MEKRKPAKMYFGSAELPSWTINIIVDLINVKDEFHKFAENSQQPKG